MFQMSTAARHVAAGTDRRREEEVDQPEHTLAITETDADRVTLATDID
jgi:hypothetical protein